MSRRKLNWNVEHEYFIQYFKSLLANLELKHTKLCDRLNHNNPNFSQFSLSNAYKSVVLEEQDLSSYIDNIKEMLTYDRRLLMGDHEKFQSFLDSIGADEWKKYKVANRVRLSRQKNPDNNTRISLTSELHQELETLSTLKNKKGAVGAIEFLLSFYDENKVKL